MAQEGRIDHEKLTAFTARAFKKMGVPEEDAWSTARILVATDLRGIDSHGMARLGHYILGLKEGRINPTPEIKVLSSAPATAVVDGDRGLGFVVGQRAMMEAIRRAEAVGAGFITVRNSNHYGAGGNYSMMALQYNMIGISMTASPRGMEVPGSRGRGAGINVISIAAPAGRETPFVLDMATTVVAAGKMEIAVRDNKNVPEGWAVDTEGKPLLNPTKYGQEGALLPLGGNIKTGAYKGFGLTVAVDILCRVLSGTAGNSMTLGNHFFGALRIDSFLPTEDFKKAMDDMVQTYRSLPKAPGVDRITIAGEPEQAIENERRKNGIPLHPVVRAALQKMAGEIGIKYDLG